jgi:anaerobic magnesium-protoporphyrin IX monomethyl ester cyclase
MQRKGFQMRCVLANPPWYEPGFYGVRAGSRWPHLEDTGSRYRPFPFFLAYTAALLEKNGYFPFAIDAVGEQLNIPAFLYKLEKLQPDLLIMEVSTPSFSNDLMIVDQIRNKFGYALKIALCGPNHLMINPAFLENNRNVDFVFRGEYEFITLELIQALEQGYNLNRIDGLNYRDINGEIKINRNRDLLKNIDSIPWPSRHHFPMSEYYDEISGDIEPAGQIWASRGCPYMCIFCVWPQLVYGGSNYRVRDPADVADEMEWMVKTYGFKFIYFDDDTFNIGKERMLKLCSCIRERDINVPWAIMARADGMDREVLESMKSAGLYSVKYGIESADQKIVDVSGKKLDLSEALENIQITRKLDIYFHLTFTFGLPGETHETCRKTLQLALDLNPATAQFSICTPMPGSRYYDLARQKGYLKDGDWNLYTGFNSAAIRTEALSFEELEEIRDKAQKTWDRHVLKRTRYKRFKKRVTHVTNKLFDK